MSAPPNGLETHGTEGYDGYVHHDHLPLDPKEGASMSDAELRILAFLTTSDASRPADLPDWILARLEGDRPDEMTPELITVASLLYARRLWPGIGLDDARARIARYADDPARLDDLQGRIAAFRLSCCFERLKRAGRFADVLIDDPFDPEGSVCVELTEAQWQAVHAAAPPRDASHGPYGFSRN
ncbi:MAG: hypothetical protein JO368_03995 [Acidimicrobiales bacterium]|nr:hypothetical protein [Acidimicrobiales bacterium]